MVSRACSEANHLTPLCSVSSPAGWLEASLSGLPARAVLGCSGRSNGSLSCSEKHR